MSTHLFVSPSGRPHGRWLDAFPGARVVSDLGAAAQRLESAPLVWALGQRRTALRQFLQQHPATRLVVLSLQPDSREALDAFETGARGYCHALATGRVLGEVALVVSHGGLWVGTDLMQKAVQVVGRLGESRAERSAWDALTAREATVAHWLLRGASNKEIARRLNISERTVKAHLAAMFAKLQVRDRLQLAVHLQRSPAQTPITVDVA